MTAAADALHRPPKPEPLREWRCPQCRRVVAHARLVPGSMVRLTCKRCKAEVRIGA